MDILKLSTCEPCTFEPVGSVTNVFFDDRCQQVSNLGIKEPLAHQPFYINIPLMLSQILDFNILLGF